MGPVSAGVCLVMKGATCGLSDFVGIVRAIGNGTEEVGGHDEAADRGHLDVEDDIMQGNDVVVKMKLIMLWKMWHAGEIAASEALYRYGRSVGGVGHVSYLPRNVEATTSMGSFHLHILHL